MHLVVIFGPLAVGKMSVGREVARLTPYRLLHNHATIDPLLEVFPWGTPAFGKLKREFRVRIIEEAIGADLPGLVVTFAWPLAHDPSTAELAELLEPVLRTGGRVDFVELYADQATRLTREGTEERLAAKPAKRDLTWAREHLLESDADFVWSTGPDVPLPITGHPHTVVDNTHLTPTEAATEIVGRLDLPRER